MPILFALWTLAILPAQSTYEIVDNPWRKPARLEGRVSSPDRKPIAGALLEIFTRTHDGPVSLGSVFSMKDGRFSLAVAPVPNPKYKPEAFVLVSAPGWAPSRIADVYIPSPLYDMGRLVLHRPVELRGTVSDSSGMAVVGAKIHALLGPQQAPDPHHAKRAPIARTNSRGEFFCRSLPPGLVTLGISAREHANLILEPRTLVSDAANEMHVSLEQEKSVRFRVLSTRGSPIGGARAHPLGSTWRRPMRTQETVPAFWRSPSVSDERGWIEIRNLPRDFRGDYRVTASDHEPRLISIDNPPSELILEDVVWIDVIALQRRDGSQPEIRALTILDETRSPGMCWTYNRTRFAELRVKSPAVTALSPGHWRVAWNSDDCYVDGGPPTELEAIATDGTRAAFDLSNSAASRSRLLAELSFEAPARLSGIVRDSLGAPVQLRIGFSLGFPARGYRVVTTDRIGRFVFEGMAGRWHTIYSYDEHWEIRSSCSEVTLSPGEDRAGFEIIADYRPQGSSGRAIGVVTMGGKTPTAPVLLALDEIPNQHLPDAIPRGLTWTDNEGRFEFKAFHPRSYHVLPKHAADHSGGWRSFANEFPRHNSRWPWMVCVPPSGEIAIRINYPPESEWDDFASLAKDDE